MANAIDFLPLEYHRKNAGRRFKAWSVIVAAALGLLVTASFVGQRFQRGIAERQLTAVLSPYAQCVAQQRAMEAIQADLAKERSMAELYTYLRHPRPRSGLLTAVLRPLPEAIRFERVQILRETEHLTVAAPAAKAADEKNAARLTPPERDLKRMCEDSAKTRIVIRLTGTTTDGAALHHYLGELGGNDLFTKAELESLERVVEKGSELARFRAALTVRPGLDFTKPNADATKDSVVGNGRTP